MVEGADSGAVNAGKRRPQAGRRSRQNQPKKSSGSRVTLEKVLGISTTSGSSLTSDPNTGLIAYPAGCVVVLLQPRTSRQSHIINACRKPFSALSFSPQGRHLATGESGHMPCVRVWEVGGVPVGGAQVGGGQVGGGQVGGGQVAEVQSHKYGVSCVAFSPSGCYIVSVGFQHDMTVSVWDWRKGAVIASNKVSSRVLSVSFSQDDSYFVTAGNRHVKFWYLDASKEQRVNSTVPLIGRSGLLDEQKNSVFSGVACGRGRHAASTYGVTSAGLLCLFNARRSLEAWVDLKTAAAGCLAVSEDRVFVGCAEGLVRVFSPGSLRYVATLPAPPHQDQDRDQDLDPGGGGAPGGGGRRPDTLALSLDGGGRRLTAVYGDHSLYVWNTEDLSRTRAELQAQYHRGCIWGLEVYPELQDPGRACLPPSSFLTCSSDSSIRLWHAPPGPQQDPYSTDLIRTLYVGDREAEGKSGIRVLRISPDGQHLAAGDRCGNLRIFGLQFLDELKKIEAHDSEVLCLEFSPTSTGVSLLASASRDRLVHVFDPDRDYSLQQTLNDHSSSITAVKFAGRSPEPLMVSCGADKSIYFQAAEQTAEGLVFSRRHHLVEKTTLYDMDLDPSHRNLAVACQDRNVRIYDVETGKLKRCLKGSSSEEGALLKVQIDPSGSFLATSCSDKNISVFDFESGECVASLFGHSEIVTGMRFTPDCRHLITVSGDSCVFVWRLDPQMTSTMRRRRGLRPAAARRQPSIRRETFITGPVQTDATEEGATHARTPLRLDPPEAPPPLQTNGKLPQWFRKLTQASATGAVATAGATATGGSPRPVRSRWAEQTDPLTICSSFSPSPTQDLDQDQDLDLDQEEDQDQEEDFHPQSLESLLGDEEEEEEEEHATFILPATSSSVHRDLAVDTGGDGPQGDTVEGGAHQDGVHQDGVLKDGGHQDGVLQGAEPAWSAQLSPDSACWEGSAGSLEQLQEADVDSLSQSSAGSLPEDEDRNSLKNHFDTLASSRPEELFDTDLRSLQPEENFLNPRLSISTRFLSRFQDRLRGRFRVPAPSRRTSEGGATENQRGGRQTARRRRASCEITQQPRRGGARRRHTVLLVRCRRPGDDSSLHQTRPDPPQDPPPLETPHQEPPPQQGERGDPPPPSDAPPEDSLQALATPPVMSQGRVPSWSPDQTPTNENQRLTQSPAPSGPEPLLAPPPSPPRPRPPGCGSAPSPPQQEQEAAARLLEALRQALRLFQQPGPGRGSSVLRAALLSARSDLQEALVLEARPETQNQDETRNQDEARYQARSKAERLEEDGTLELLEKYSDKLVQMVQSKLS